MTQTKTMYVLLHGGRPEPQIDEDKRPMLFVSRAHAGRVIRWLGLVGRSIATATEEMFASGEIVRAGMRPNRDGRILIG